MKIAVVGGGNAGCLTALHYSFHTRFADFIEIELIHNPDILPEPVGQATTLDPPQLLWGALNFDWYHNPIHATFKSGILYEGWGKKNDQIFHRFPADRMAMHFCPWELQESILKSGWFKVTEGDVDPKDVDADYVFDCRGKPKDFSDYEELKNPTNACIVAKPNWDTTKTFWSRHVATPDGWTFIIPTVEDSPSRNGSVGYCYNSNITSQEDAENNMLEMFDVDITRHISYKNYVAKNPVIDNRIFLNGNRLFFLEPLESTAIEAYLAVGRFLLDAILLDGSIGKAEINIKEYVNQLQNFVLWHYQAGSKYNTLFWEYAQKFKFNDSNFSMLVEESRSKDLFHDMNSVGIRYGQWPLFSFNIWDSGT